MGGTRCGSCQRAPRHAHAKGWVDAASRNARGERVETGACVRPQVYGELAVGLDQGVQLLYLAALLGLLSTGTFLVVRQVRPPPLQPDQADPSSKIGWWFVWAIAACAVVNARTWT